MSFSSIKLFKFSGWLFLITAYILFVPCTFAQEKTPTLDRHLSEQEPFRILYLNLRSDLWPWLLSMYSESRHHLQNISEKPVEMIVENTTFADIESPSARAAFATLFRERYADNIDFIVVRRHFAQIKSVLDILPDVPMIISDQNLAIPKEWDTPPENVHEVRYAFRIDKTADIALKMRPHTRKIIVIAGLAPFDRSLEVSAREQLGNRYKDVDVTYWSGLPVSELKNRVATLSKDHLVLFLAATIDVNGTPAISADVAKQLSSVANVPLFGIADTFMPEGIIGGYVISSKVSGRRAAEMMHHLLQGNTLPGITYTEDYGECQFDWQQMRRWGIAEKLVPEKSTILNRPDNFLERNTWFLPAFSILGTLLLLTVLALVFYLRMRNKTAHALKLSEEKFRKLYENSPDMYVSVSPLNANIVLCNQTLLDKTGYSRDEIIGFPVFKLYHPDCLNEAKAAFQEFVQTGQVQNKELTLKRKDGNKIQVTLNVSAVRDENGKILLSSSSWRDITERKQAEQALQESEERYHSIAENAGALISEMDINGKFVYVNQTHKKILGYDPKELLNNQINFSHPEEAETAIKAFAQMVKDHKPTNHIWRFQHKNGEWLSFRCLGSTYTTASGEIRVIVVSYDITEYLKAQKKLETNEKRFRALFEQSGDYCMILDPNTDDGIPRILDASQSACALHGYTYDEFIGRPVADIDDQEGKKLVLKNTQTIMKGKPFFTKNTHIRKDGTTFPVSVHANRIDVEGEKPLIFTTEYNITEQKQAEQALQKSEEKFRGIYEQSPIAIQLFNKSGKLVDVNPQSLKTFGLLDKEPLLGYDMWSSPYLTEEQAQALKNGRPVSLSVELDFTAAKKNNLFPTQKSGTLYFEMHAIPLTHNQKITGYLVQMIDETERKKMQAQLLQSQKMDSIGRLAGGIAHDFNNILMPIMGYIEMALSELSTDTELYANLKQVQDASERAKALTRQILAFSRKQILQMHVIDLNSIVTNFEIMIHRLIGEDIELHTLLKPVPYHIKADPGQIEQVLMNLAVNARDAMPSGGKLTIETAHIYLDKDFFSDHNEQHLPGEYVMLAVSDTGCGMDAETSQQIFEPFFTTKERGKGTGLGLSTVFGIIKQHNGYIWVYSEPNTGTTFKIYLPKVEKTKSISQEKTILCSEQAHGSASILVVEDEKMVRKLVCKTLISHGYKVHEAQGPNEALAFIEQSNKDIDLLVTDVIMPEMNGKSLYDKITVMIPDIAVLYISGYTDDIIVHQGIMDETVNFMQKPFTIQKLLQKVGEIIEKHQK